MFAGVWSSRKGICSTGEGFACGSACSDGSISVRVVSDLEYAFIDYPLFSDLDVFAGFEFMTVTGIWICSFHIRIRGFQMAVIRLIPHLNVYVFCS